jgi:hypothetical protein
MQNKSVTRFEVLLEVIVLWSPKGTRNFGRPDMKMCEADADFKSSLDKVNYLLIPKQTLIVSH